MFVEVSWLSAIVRIDVNLNSVPKRGGFHSFNVKRLSPCTPL
jgi:hypothetical protein